MSAPLLALLVLGSWVALAALLVGVARLARGACGWASTDLLSDVWVGYAGTLAALQLWHLVAPIDGRAFLAFATAGVAGLLIRGPAAGRLRARLRRVTFALVFLFALALALEALVATSIYDTGLYHLSSVRWAREAPIVPGLANLHFRLALNNASFLWCALVAAGPWDALAIHVAQGVLFMPLVVRAGLGASRVLFGRGAPRPAHLYWPLAAILVFHPHLDAPAAFTPDHVVTLLCLELVAHLPACTRGAVHDRRLVVLLAATLIVVKLSGAIAAVGCAFLLLTTGRKRRHREGILAVALMVALLVPWSARGVLLSGYPLFPSTVLRFDVPWAFDEEQAARELAFIQAGPRYGKLEPGPVDEADWGRRWLQRNLGRSDLTLPFALAALAVIASARRLRLTWPALGPPALALLGWFVSAPDVRFAHGFLWGLPALVASEALCAPPARRGAARVLVALAVGLTIFYWNAAGRPYQISFESVPEPNVVARTTSAGLVVHVPRSGDQTWDAPLPCAPYFDPALTLRSSPDMRSGFVVTPRRD